VALIDGHRTHCWMGGAGPTLLLLHGGLGDAELHWRPIWEQLARHTRVVAPDLPGFGQSEPLRRADWHGLLGWLEALLDTHQREPDASAGAVGNAPGVALVGNSFGGALARMFAARHPERCSQLLLVNGGMIPEMSARTRRWMASPWLAPMYALMRWSSYTGPMMRRMIPTRSVRTPEFVRSARAEGHAFVDMMRLMFSNDPPVAPFPQVATHILWGCEDGFTPPEVALKLADALSCAAPIWFSAAGHMPQLDIPDQFAGELIALTMPARSGRSAPERSHEATR